MGCNLGYTEKSSQRPVQVSAQLRGGRYKQLTHSHTHTHTHALHRLQLLCCQCSSDCYPQTAKHAL